MSKGIKIARATEQEYAHDYTSRTREEQYQYPNEDQRVTNHVNSDIEDTMTQEELYNVTPQETTTAPPANKIRAHLTSSEILEDHRQRSYKVNNKPQIYDKSDPGREAYQLNEDPREIEVNYIKNTSTDFDNRIKEEQSRDMSKPEDRYAEFSEAEQTKEASKSLTVGSKVRHKEEGIKGEVKFIGSDKVSIVWEDQTRERFALSEANNSLEVISYVDDAQSQVDPLNTEANPKTEISEEANDVLDKALAALDEEINLEDDGPTSNPAIEKIKKKAAMELIDLMQSKGLLEKNKSAEDSQLAKITAMSDNEFESFKNKVVANQLNAMDLALMGLDQDDSFDDIEDGNEYAKLKAKVVAASEKQSRAVDGIMSGDVSMFENGMLKASDFKGAVGDFSSQIAGTPSTPSREANETRSLKRSDSNIKTAAPQQKLDLSGFQGLEGLTKPINIPNQEISAKTKFSDVFGDPSFWTTITKIH